MDVSNHFSDFMVARGFNVLASPVTQRGYGTVMLDVIASWVNRSGQFVELTRDQKDDMFVIEVLDPAGEVDLYKRDRNPMALLKLALRMIGSPPPSPQDSVPARAVRMRRRRRPTRRLDSASAPLWAKHLASLAYASGLSSGRRGRHYELAGSGAMGAGHALYRCRVWIGRHGYNRGQWEWPIRTHRFGCWDSPQPILCPFAVPSGNSGRGWIPHSGGPCRTTYRRRQFEGIPL